MAFRIAAICTQYFPYSHADVIVTRWLEQVKHDVRLGFVPCTQISSLWVMQHPVGDAASGLALHMPADYNVSPNRAEQGFPRFDISQAVARKYGVPIYKTIHEALTLGTGELAVDAVILVGEHGDFPSNDYGQKLYPRKELFDEIVGSFKKLGKVVPLFCDKHLSWNIEWAQEMVRTAKTMHIPFFGGSSVPISGTLHELYLDGQAFDESMGLFYSGDEIYGIHSMEYLQSLVEKRQGSESGIKAIRTYAGDEVWAAMERGEWSRDLFEATLAAAITAKSGDYKANCAASDTKPAAIICEHVDGHKQVHINMSGHIEELIAGVKLRTGECRASTANMADLNNFVINFGHLSREIQKFFLTQQSPIAVERMLLTTLMVASYLHALKDHPGERVLTPHLEIAYQALPYRPVREIDV